MKFKKLIILPLITVMILLAVTSCGDDSLPKGYKKYSDLGLTFALPKDMDSKKVNYAPICFSKDDVYFFANVFDKIQLEEMDVDPEITVERYTEKFILLNGYDAEYVYDAATNVATFGVEYNNELVEGDYQYYYHYITRGKECLYVVIMSCDVENAATYKSVFEEWASFISVK